MMPCLLGTFQGPLAEGHARTAQGGCVGPLPPPLPQHTGVDMKTPSGVDTSKATVHYPGAKPKPLHLKQANNASKNQGLSIIT